MNMSIVACFFYGYLSVFGVIHLKLETFVYLEWRIQDM